MFKRFTQCLSIILCSTLVWTSGEGAAAAEFVHPTPVAAVSCYVFTDQAIVERSTSFLNAPRHFSLGYSFTHGAPIALRRIHPAWPISWADAGVAAMAAILGAAHAWMPGLFGDPSGILQACGLIGAILLWRPEWKGIYPAQVARRLYLMMHVTKTRGEQAGGIAVFASWFKGLVFALRARIVNFKRASLPEILDRLMRFVAWAAGGLGFEPVGNGILLIIGHLRYGTSSAPARGETHPHRFLPPRVVMVWTKVGDFFVAVYKALAILITHNGDFDWFRLFGKFRSNEEMGWYLERVLDRPATRAFWAWTGGWKGLVNPMNWLPWIRQLTIAFFSGAGRGGDSPKLAAVLDFVMTRHRLDASARFAYQWSLAGSFEEAFGGQDPNQEIFAPDKIRVSTAPNGAPSAERIASWAAVLNDVFARHQPALLAKESRHFADVRPEILAIVKAEMAAKMQELMTQQGYQFTDAQIATFIDTTMHAFFHHDLVTSVRWILMRSKGSFGFGAASTLEPGKVVNAALGQPLTHAYSLAENGSQEEGVYWLSEPAAAKVKTGPDDPGIPYRMDLPQGIVAEVTPLTVKYIRIDTGRELTTEDIVREGRIIDQVDNRYVTPLPELSDKDLVGSDIRQISQVLTAIRADWDNADSDNRQTGREFFSQLFETYLFKNLKIRISSNQLDKNPYYEEVVWQRAREYAGDLLAGRMSPAAWSDSAAHFAARIRSDLPPSLYTLEDTHKNDVDLFLTGIETSSWVGEHFMGRLKMMFPTLNIQAESSNKALAALNDFHPELNIQKGPNGQIYDFRIRLSTEKGSVKIGKRTQWLIISQHSQSYAPLNDVEKLHELHQQFGEDRIFLMTGEMDSAMGSTIGQSFARTARFRKRIFTNGSGRRPSEASTVATLAADMTAAELLMDLDRQYLEVFTPETLESLATLAAEREPGSNDNVRSPMRHKLTQEDLAHLRAARDRFIDERLPAITGVDAKMAPAGDQTLYKKIVSEGRRWADHILEGPLSVWITWGLMALFMIVLNKSPGEYAGYAGRMAGIFNFFFYAVFFRYGVPRVLRLAAYVWTGQIRDLGARPGKRTIAIGDRPHVHEILNQYVSKLFGNSPKEQGIDVQSANTNDHFIHRMAQRVVRGTLLYLGFPDWDKTSQQMGVEASRMVGSQSKGIENAGSGPEVVAVGENLQPRSNAMDTAINLTPSGSQALAAPSQQAEQLAEDLYGTMERLTTGYVFFWALAKKVSSLWLFRWLMSATQSGTRSGTTRSPVAAPDRNGNGHYKESGLIDSSDTEPLRIRSLLAAHERSQGRTPDWLAREESPSAPVPVPVAKIPRSKSKVLEYVMMPILFTLTVAFVDRIVNRGGAPRLSAGVSMTSSVTMQTEPSNLGPGGLTAADASSIPTPSPVASALAAAESLKAHDLLQILGTLEKNPNLKRRGKRAHALKEALQTQHLAAQAVLDLTKALETLGKSPGKAEAAAGVRRAMLELFQIRLGSSQKISQLPGREGLTEEALKPFLTELEKVIKSLALPTAHAVPLKPFDARRLLASA